MLKGNKGEWSEFYTFVKLLAEEKIFGADKNLEKIEAIVFPILKIIREESGGKSEYELQKGGKIKILHPEGRTAIVNASDLKTKVLEIFKTIKKSSRTFSVPLAEELFTRFGIKNLNAGNSKKEDLILKIHDFRIGKNHETGFSIKSKLGSPATLLNASAATNFTYKINGLDINRIKKINAIATKAKVRDRLFAIREAGGSLKFHDIDSDIFKKNLRKIDTIMPEIIAEVLLAYYSDKGALFPKLIQHMRDSDVKILNFDLSPEDHAYKIKMMLYNAALGMVPASRWDGALRADGGVIIVREDGEVVCFNIYNTGEFQTYLFDNTRLDSPSTTRHGYGKIYQENNQVFIKLNLQVRFIK